MAGDTLVADAAELSPRANIALLTLQLRAATREADEAELAEQQWDADAASAQLRNRLQPLVEERRAALDDELAQARTEAAARIESVRAAALRAGPPAPEVVDEPAVEVLAVMDEPEEPPLVEVPVAAPVASIVVVPPMPLPAPVVELPLDRLTAGTEIGGVPAIVSPGDGEVDTGAIFAPPIHPASAAGVPGFAPPHLVLPPPFAPPTVAASAIEVEVPHVVPQPPASEGASVVWARPNSSTAAPLTADDVRAIVTELLAGTSARQAAALPMALDSEAFSRTFASAFGAALGAALDERLVATQYGQPAAWPRYAAAPVAAKKSFWANMWHADVMMSLLAAVIVLVVLIREGLVNSATLDTHTNGYDERSGCSRTTRRNA